jgi:protoporphyrinogen IX oxidase
MDLLISILCMAYLYLKALHIIGVVCWFAGLFYVVRLFIYHVEAGDKPCAEAKVLRDQFKIMERRLWLGITVPSMVVTSGSGLVLMILLEAWSYPWFILKLVALVVLFGYHHHCGKLRKGLLEDRCTLSSSALRGYNEIATVLLVLIVLAVVVRSLPLILYGMLFLMVLSLVIFFFFRKRLQGKASAHPK